MNFHVPGFLVPLSFCFLWYLKNSLYDEVHWYLYMSCRHLKTILALQFPWCYFSFLIPIWTTPPKNYRDCLLLFSTTMANCPFLNSYKQRWYRWMKQDMSSIMTYFLLTGSSTLHSAAMQLFTWAIVAIVSGTKIHLFCICYSWFSGTFRLSKHVSFRLS